jgi:hypothetical protein
MPTPAIRGLSCIAYPSKKSLPAEKRLLATGTVKAL